MKVYNIRNTHEFFATLSACKGIVEMVDKTGTKLRLTQGDGKSGLLPFPQIYGEINELELYFEDGEDCRKILSYLINRRGRSA